MSWLSRIFGRRHLYDDLAEEVREHIEEKTEQLMRLENLSRADARHAALRAFGNPTLVETRSREVWQWSRPESVITDLNLAFRRLRKSPAFAATVLLTLAIGIGANTAVFSVVNSVLLKPLPYPDGDRLVSLWLNAPGAAGLTNFQKVCRSPRPCISASARTTGPFNHWEYGSRRRPMSLVRLATTLGFSRNFRAGLGSSKWPKHYRTIMFYPVKANGFSPEPSADSSSGSSLTEIEVSATAG